MTRTRATNSAQHGQGAVPRTFENRWIVVNRPGKSPEAGRSPRQAFGAAGGAVIGITISKRVPLPVELVTSATQPSRSQIRLTR